MFMLCRDVLVIATPYASGFDHFAIADEVQFKFDRCCRSLHESVSESCSSFVFFAPGYKHTLVFVYWNIGFQ